MTPPPPRRLGTGPGDSSQGAEPRPPRPRPPPPLPQSPKAHPLPQRGREERPQQARGLRDATAAPAPPAEGPRRRGLHPPPSPARPRIPVEPPHRGVHPLRSPPPREEPSPAAPSPRLKDRKGSAATQHQDVQATGAPSPRLPYIEASPPSARRLFQKPPEPSGRTLPNRRRGRAPAPAPWTPPAPTLGPRGPTPSRPAPHGRAARARADRRTPARPGAPGKVSRLPGPSPLALPPRPLRSARRRPRPHDPCSARVGPTAALVNRQPCPGRGECDRGLSARGLIAEYEDRFGLVPPDAWDRFHTNRRWGEL
ncbi:uncharacterized protein [Globicephala melas]|uniref:uncharacterized protein n=1 Tax=Globicephala melas TaxID=9731 RepID=UPI0038734004